MITGGAMALGGALVASHLATPAAPAGEIFSSESAGHWGWNRRLDEMVARSEAQLEKVSRTLEERESNRDHYERLEQGQLNFADAEMDSFIHTGDWHHAENAGEAMDRAEMYGDFAGGGSDGGGE